MRRLGCSWPWIVLSQLYAVTLLEANAIRVGMAVTVVLYVSISFLRNVGG